jgi:hypothetical protein
MKFGKVYIEWVQFLKKKGLYARYMYEYARTNEYVNARDALMVSGEYFRSEDARKKIKNHNYKFLNSTDRIIIASKGHSFIFDDLRHGMSNLVWYRGNIDDFSKDVNRINWTLLVNEFGEKYGYKNEETMPYGEMYFNIPAPSYAVTTERIANNTRLVNRSRYEDAHAGQWYDRFYNRGRNNNRNNNRWRR